MAVLTSWALLDTVTSDALIASVRRRGMLPNSSQTLTDSDILEFANEEILTYILPLLTQEGVGEQLVAVTDTTTVPGQDKYLIPDDAAVSKLRDLQIQSGTSFESLQYIEPELLSLDDTAYTFEGEYVVLRPAPTEAITLRFKYWRRPGSLVLKAQAGLITDITGAVVTVSPDGLFGESTTSTVDIVRGRPGFGTLVRESDVAVDATGAILTFSDEATLVGTSVGDFICVPGTAPFPQLPKEIHPLLNQRVTMRCLEALGDPKFQAAKVLCDELEMKALQTLTPRSSGTGQVIVNRNGPGWGLSSTSRRFRR